MTNQKTTELSFGLEEKQSFKARLKQLIGHRSIRAAATAWGLSYSTLNNYIAKGTEPSFFVMALVAHKENASLEWLAYGSGAPYKNRCAGGNESNELTATPLEVAWGMIFKSLNTDDVTALISLLMREGAKGVLALSVKNDDVNRLFLDLPSEEKERLMALHEAKKGASQESEVSRSSNPQDKQAC